MKKKSLRIVSVLLTVILLMSVFVTLVAAGQGNGRGEVQIQGRQSSEHRWWKPGFEGYSVEQIKARIGFEDTTDKISPRPLSIVWEEDDTFAANVVWTGSLNKIRAQENTNTYRFSGRSPLPFCFLMLSLRSYEFATGKLADVPLEVWYRSSLDGVSFGDWHRVRGERNVSDTHYMVPSFALSLPHGEVHRYFEILIHAPSSIRLDNVDLSISDHTTNTLIKHGLMTDIGIREALEMGIISFDALDPSVVSDLMQRGFIQDVLLRDVVNEASSVNVNDFNANPSSSPARPAIISRSQWWGPNLPREDYWVNSRRRPPVSGAITHAIIHHTACIPNNPADPMVNVQRIWREHAQGDRIIPGGWGDIGYNFLVDHLGNIYHGRFNLNLDASPPQDVWGAHAVAFNTGSMGIAFIGTFCTEQPRTAAINSANRLIAWRFHQRNIDPLSVARIGEGGTGLRTPRNITRIFGHIDVAGTRCPGAFFYDRLPRLIRLTVASLMGRMRSPILYAPMGGEGWRRDWATRHPTELQSGIVWWHFPEVPSTSNVRIDISTNSGHTWQTLVASTPNDGNHRWPFPSGERFTTVRMRVVSLQNPAVQSTSVADFYLW